MRLQLSRLAPALLVAGGLLFHAVARSDDTDKKTLTRADISPPERNWALVIGVSDYTDTDIYPLSFTDDDARMFAEKLTQSGVFPKEHVLLLEEQSATKPTRSGIISQLSRLDRLLQPLPTAPDVPGADTVVVYFSGHGAASERLDGERRNYLIPSDATLNAVADTSISLEDLLRRLDRISARRKIVIVDACRNRFTADHIMGSPPAWEERKYKQSKGTIILQSAEFGEYAYEDPELQASAFTHFLLEGMDGPADGSNGEAEDGVLTVTELYHYTLSAMRTYGLQTGRTMLPFISGEWAGSIPLMPVVNYERPPPSIEYFQLNTSQISLGGTARLSWRAADADQCEITPDIGAVTASGEQEISPQRQTTYTLHCESDIGTREETTSLSVLVPARITALDAKPARISRGEAVQLHWASEGADRCTLSGQSDVSTSGDFVVRPIQDTTYELRCTGPSGTDVRTTSVVVDPLPAEITRFVAEDRGSGQYLLRWSSENTTNCNIRPDLGSVSTSGSESIAPTGDTDFTLTCYGDSGSDQAHVSVSGRSVEILSFSADDKRIDAGDRVRLSWRTRYAERCEIEPDLGRVDPNDRESVYPTADTRYRLSCENGDSYDTASVSISVNDKPPELYCCDQFNQRRCVIAFNPGPVGSPCTCAGVFGVGRMCQ